MASRKAVMDSVDASGAKKARSRKVVTASVASNQELTAESRTKQRAKKSDASARMVDSKAAINAGSSADSKVSRRVNRKARSTGPVSAAGKSKSSLNALSHGLTSTRVLPDELQLVEQFERELTQHYSPQSPLETLQIQRIAFCRAKLAKLMDIEVAGRELARFDIDHRPEQTMQRLVQYPERLRQWALMLLSGRNPLDAIKIGEDELSAIHEEILNAERPTLDPQGQTIDGEQAFERLLPKLSAFLHRTIDATVESNSRDAQFHRPSLLKALSYWCNQINALSSSLTPAGSHETAFEQMLQRVHLSEDFLSGSSHAADASAQYTPAQYNVLTRKALQVVADLAASLAQLPKVMQSFEQTKQWMLRAADLNADNADRMMKYQSMLERRLSTAIGELIELQKLRP